MASNRESLGPIFVTNEVMTDDRDRCDRNVIVLVDRWMVDRRDDVIDIELGLNRSQDIPRRRVGIQPGSLSKL